MAAISFSHINTTPGAKSWCAPSEPVEDYNLWLIDALSKSQGTMQYFGFLARLIKNAGWSGSYPENKPEIEGPYANELLVAVTSKMQHTTKEAMSRRNIRIKADAELNKRQAKEGSSQELKSPSSSSKKQSKPLVPRPSAGEAVESWSPSSAAKEKNKEFMNMFKSKSTLKL